MTSSGETAIERLNKWRTASARIQCVFGFDGGGFNFVGSVEATSPLHIRGNESELFLSLDGVDIKPETPTDAPSTVREAAVAGKASGLTLLLPSGDRCFLVELRRPS
jgi:hypothetical protein